MGSFRKTLDKFTRASDIDNSFAIFQTNCVQNLVILLIHSLGLVQYLLDCNKFQNCKGKQQICLQPNGLQSYSRLKLM